MSIYNPNAPRTNRDEPSPLVMELRRQLLRLLSIRRDQSQELNSEGIRLVNRAIYSRYCFLADLGDEEESTKILHQYDSHQSSTQQN